MIWNGIETGRWQIPHDTQEKYSVSFDKLRALGFVFTDERIKSADEIFNRFGFGYPHIAIGYSGYGDAQSYNPCKMMLTGFRIPQEDYTTISVDDWIARCWPAYDAA